MLNAYNTTSISFMVMSCELKAQDLKNVILYFSGVN